MAQAVPVSVQAALTRQGLSPSRIALPPGPWPTVLAFLQQRFSHVAEAEWRARFQRGEVCDEAGQALPASAPYCPQTKVLYYRRLAHEPRIPFDETVVYQDAHLVVADKPHFLPVIPSGRYVQETLLVRLKQRLGLPDLQPVHRLDMDTAGLVLFSVNAAERGAYQALFRDRQIEKHYEAIAPFRPDLTLPRTHSSRLERAPQFMQAQEVPGTANSHTHIALIERLPTAGDGTEWARYALQPITGQRHQLRAHLSALGIPILGDRIYPHHQPEPEVPDYSQPLQLLAKRLVFQDPVTGELRVFESARTLTGARGALPFADDDRTANGSR